MSIKPLLIASFTTLALTSAALAGNSASIYSEGNGNSNSVQLKGRNNDGQIWSQGHGNYNGVHMQGRNNEGGIRSYGDFNRNDLKMRETRW